MLFKPVATVEPFSTGGPVALQGDYLATAFDSKLIVTSFSTGQKRFQIDGDGEPLTAIFISPDEEIIVTASRSLQIHIYSLADQRRLKSLAKAHESPIMAMTIDATGTLLATGGAEGAVKVWDIKGGFVTHNFKGHGGIVTCLKFFGKLGSTDWRLLSGSDDNKARVWDLVKSKCIKVLDNHSSTVRAVEWNKTGDVILTGGRDKVLTLYKNLENVGTLAVLDQVEAAGFASSKSIYTGIPTGLKLWSLQGQELASWEIPGEEAALSEIVRISENRLLLVLSDQTLVEVNIANDAIEVIRFISGNYGEIIDLAITKDQAVVATNSQDIRLVDLGHPFEFTPLQGHADIVLSIDVLGQWLVSAGKDKQARLWDLKSKECKLVMSGHAGAIGACAISKVGKVPKFILTGSQDLTIKKWDADGQAEYTRKAHDKDINTIAVSPDDKYFATGSQDRTAKVWSVATGEVVGVLRGHKRGIWNLKFGANNTIITAAGDKTVKVWSLHDFTCLRTFEGHLNSVLKVVPYLDFVASAGGDGLVKVWDQKTNECLATLDNHEEKVWSLATYEDKLVSGGGDGVLTVWQDYTEEDQAQKNKEEEEQLEQQQELENSVRNKDWQRAISLALKLNHPLRLLKLFNQVKEEREPESITGLKAVDEVIAGLEGPKLRKLMERVRDWNTNGRTSGTAQTILQAVLATHSSEELSRGPMMPIFTAILAYSQRHLTRVGDLLESSYSLDYALKEMSFLA